MTRRENIAATLLSPPVRLSLRIILLALTAASLAGTSLIALRAYPGDFAEYGLMAAQLTIIGKVCALLAGALVLLQFGLSAKLKFLDRVFGTHLLLSAHRVLGVSAVVSASLHPLLIFAPRAREIGAFRLEIWPALIGAVLLIGLWTGVCAGLWRKFLRLPYQTWTSFHYLGMFLATVLLAIHVMSVTDDLKSGWPLYALIITLGVYAALFAWAKVVKPNVVKNQRYTVNKVTSVGEDTYAIDLSPEDGRVFPYAPGQFAFVTFHSEALPLERHPWTISSAPTRPESLVFTIKCSGDFTALIGRLRPRDTADVDGPYGLFSYLAHDRDPNRELVMIAGGVGITPMLSMLRYMADTGDTRKTTLVWSNRTEANILCRDELESLEGKLEDLSIQHVLTRQKKYQGPSGRLDKTLLTDLLLGCSREAAVFVCGPPPMMDNVRRALKRIGFRSSRIHTERFSI
jgi:predicted ferric reductase